jgi:hypothetical protein
MTKRMRVLLCLIAIALAVSPLRGVFALPVAGAADDVAHCATMAQGMHAMDHMNAVMPDSFPHDPDHHCKQGCVGDCCNGSCGTCAHACLALPGTPAAGSDTHFSFLTIEVVYRYAGRSIPPPYRPPIALPG